MKSHKLSQIKSYHQIKKRIVQKTYIIQISIRLTSLNFLPITKDYCIVFSTRILRLILKIIVLLWARRIISRLLPRTAQQYHLTLEQVSLLDQLISCTTIFFIIISLHNFYSMLDVAFYVNKNLFSMFNSSNSYKNYMKELRLPSQNPLWFSPAAMSSPTKKTFFFDSKIRNHFLDWLAANNDDFGRINSALSADELLNFFREKLTNLQFHVDLLQGPVALINTFPELEKEIANFGNKKYLIESSHLAELFQNELQFLNFWQSLNYPTSEDLKAAKILLPELLTLLWKVKTQFVANLNKTVVLGKNAQFEKEATTYVLNSIAELSKKKIR